MVNLNDVLSQHHSKGISLLKLLGKEVLDIIGEVSYEDGEKTFIVESIVFKDGSVVRLVGESMEECYAYIDNLEDHKLDQETLKSLIVEDDT